MSALYRKYRPKSLGELIGQETTVEVLTNAAKQNRLSHAYLFYGARGTGKTSVARLLAKIANCEKRYKDPAFCKQGEPCNDCRVCIEIDNGQAMDVVEIDAASNRGIDEIRNLQEEVRLSPTSYKYKVFIIDEAHMLTTAAFNALLKTLEEPPEHAIFILATTEFEKISPTIASRTQRFSFRRLPKVQVVRKLSSISEKESLNIDPEAIELIASAGEGSLRDSESLLDQVLSFAVLEGKKISMDDVERIVGKVGLAKIDEFAGLVLKKDTKKSLEYLAHINAGGYNIPQFTKDFIHYLRRILALQVNLELESLFEQELTGDELRRMKAHLGTMDSVSQARLIRSLIRAYGEIRYSPFATIPIEVALVENFEGASHKAI